LKVIDAIYLAAKTGKKPKRKPARGPA